MALGTLVFYVNFITFPLHCTHDYTRIQAIDVDTFCTSAEFSQTPCAINGWSGSSISGSTNSETSHPINSPLDYIYETRTHCTSNSTTNFSTSIRNTHTQSNSSSCQAKAATHIAQTTYPEKNSKNSPSILRSGYNATNPDTENHSQNKNER